MFEWLFKRKPAPKADRVAANAVPAEYIPGFRIENTAKRLSGSISIAGNFYRWQSIQHFKGGADIWRTFQDGPWKWVAQQRFAGKEANCGHFFALTKAGACAEAAFYKIDTATAGVESMRVTLDLQHILDLTDQNAMKLAFNAVVNENEFNIPFIAEEFVEIEKGGTILTNRIGHWACRRGYEGVLFLGARKLHGPDKTKADPRGLWNYNLFNDYLDMFRSERDALNLAVFRGRYLLSRMSTYRMGKVAEEKNPFFAVPEEDIETKLLALSEYKLYGEDFQEQKRRTTFLDKIKYVPSVDQSPK